MFTHQVESIVLHCHGLLKSFEETVCHRRSSISSVFCDRGSTGINIDDQSSSYCQSTLIASRCNRSARTFGLLRLFRHLFVRASNNWDSLPHLLSPHPAPLFLFFCAWEAFCFRLDGTEWNRNVFDSYCIKQWCCWKSSIPRAFCWGAVWCCWTSKVWKLKKWLSKTRSGFCGINSKVGSDLKLAQVTYMYFVAALCPTAVLWSYYAVHVEF